MRGDRSKESFYVSPNNTITKLKHYTPTAFYHQQHILLDSIAKERYDTFVMPTRYKEKRISPYTPRQLFDLVADVDSYSEFIHWISASNVIKRDMSGLVSDITIKFKAFTYTYRSTSTFTKPDDQNETHLIAVNTQKGHFKYLDTLWKFEPSEDAGKTIVHFEIDFAFNAALLERLIGTFFEKASIKMGNAFEKRAVELYGSDILLDKD